MAALTFVGVGCATDFASAETCVLYRGKATILVDCGPHCPQRLTQHVPDPHLLDCIYVTHRHGDHCFGLGAWLLWLRIMGRKRPLTLCAEVATLEWLSRLLDIGYPGAFTSVKAFPLELRPMLADSVLEQSGTRLRIAPTSHNVESHALRIDDGSLSVGFSGDGQPTEQSMRLFEGCGAIVQECAFAEAEHSHHATLRDLEEIRAKIRPRQLFVTHCVERDRPRIEAAMKSRAGSQVTFPRPGETIPIEGAD